MELPNLLSDLWSTTVPFAALTLGSLALYLHWRGGPRHRLPLPPGPRPLPLIGNLFDIPVEKPWEVYNKWREEYGEMIYMEAMGQRILVLNSLGVVNDLLVARATNYSNRGFSPVIQMIRFDWAFSLMHYGPVWREHRRLFHRLLNYTQVDRFHTIIEEEIAAFLPRLLADPEDFLNLIRYVLGGIIMRISYGSDDYEYNQRLSVDAGNLVNGFMEYSAPGRLLVGMFPILRHVPSWLPGAGWKRTLDELGRLSDAVIKGPFNDTRERLKYGLQQDSNNLATQFIEGLPDEDDSSYKHQETTAINTAAVAYVAGADTTVSSSYALILALAMNPEIQRKAQEQIDAVVGSGRLPTFADIDQLPYIHAIVKETNRWWTVLPMALPHVVTRDDEYNGYRIPAGTVVLPNSWAIMHDPRHFGSDAMIFRPERYFDKNGNIDPRVLSPDAGSFGYGRRICPGRHLSDRSMTMMITSVLAVFDIKQSHDETGAPIPLSLNFTSSLLCTPHAFTCDIGPRSKSHADIIMSYNTQAARS